MKNYIVLLLTALYIIPAYCSVLPNQPNTYVQLAPPNDITTFELNPAESNAGWRNLRFCVYDSVTQSVECVPDSQQNIMVYKRSNLTETTSPMPPKRSPGDNAVLIGTYQRQVNQDPTTNKLTPITFYVWKMRYENPQ